MIDYREETHRMPETLAVHITRKGWRPGRLAQEAGLSYALINKAMNGQKIHINSANKISKALGVPLSEIKGLNYSG